MTIDEQGMLLVCQCQAPDVSPHVMFSMSLTCCDATMAQSMVSMLFTGAIILRCQKTRLDEFISTLVTRKRYFSLDRGVGYRRRFDSFQPKNYPNHFSMQPPEGDFSSQLQQYVNDRKRSREDKDAPICNDFSQYDGVGGGRGRDRLLLLRDPRVLVLLCFPLSSGPGANSFASFSALHCGWKRRRISMPSWAGGGRATE